MEVEEEDSFLTDNDENYREWKNERVNLTKNKICSTIGKEISNKTSDINNTLDPKKKVIKIEERTRLINKWRVCHFLNSFYNNPSRMIYNNRQNIKKLSPLLFNTLTILNFRFNKDVNTKIKKIINNLSPHLDTIAQLIQPGSSRLHTRQFFMPLISTTLKKIS